MTPKPGVQSWITKGRSEGDEVAVTIISVTGQTELNQLLDNSKVLKPFDPSKVLLPVIVGKTVPGPATIVMEVGLVGQTLKA